MQLLIHLVELQILATEPLKRFNAARAREQLCWTHFLCLCVLNKGHGMRHLVSKQLQCDETSCDHLNNIIVSDKQTSAK